jgi:hypothetical protein
MCGLLKRGEEGRRGPGKREEGEKSIHAVENP